MDRPGFSDTAGHRGGGSCLPHLFTEPLLFLQIVLSGLQLGFVYALIALGYTMVYGIVKLINFAHGDVFMCGAFVSYFAVAQFGLHTWPMVVFPGLYPSIGLVIGSLTVILLSMIVCAVLALSSSGWPTSRCAMRHASRL